MTMGGGGRRNRNRQDEAQDARDLILRLRVVGNAVMKEQKGGESGDME